LWLPFGILFSNRRIEEKEMALKGAELTEKINSPATSAFLRANNKITAPGPFSKKQAAATSIKCCFVY
jgi:hypothetical protein